MNYKNNVKALYAFSLLTSISLFSAIMVPFMTDWAGITFQQILFLQSWFMLSMFLLEVPTGVIADKFGRKTSLALGAGINAISAIVYGLTPNFYVFMLGEFLFALSITLVSGADKALIYDTLKKTKETKKSTKIFSNYAIYAALGYMIAGPVGSIIAKYYPLNYPMLLTAIPFGIACLIMFLVKEPKTKQKLDEAKQFRMAINGVKYLIKHSKLRSLAINNALFMLSVYYLFWIWQPTAKLAQIDIIYFGFIVTGMNLTGMLFMKKIDWFQKKIGSKKALLTLSIMPGFFFIIMAITKNPIIIVLSIFLIMGARQSRRPLMSSYMQKYIQSHNRATVNSAISMSATILIIISNLFMGVLIDYSLNITLIIIGTFSILFNIFSKPEA